MRSILLLSIFFLGIYSNVSGQQTNTWTQWNWLIGEWQGEGNGQPGQGEGTFSFSFDLDKNILVRKNHTIFPANNGKPAFVHNDLIVVYPGNDESSAQAIYFDNEHHVINYKVTYQGKTIILTSNKVANVPVFRLSYISLEDGKVNIKFEMSQDGEKFMTYLEGKSRKIK